jgi:hypothetical protein
MAQDACGIAEERGAMSETMMMNCPRCGIPVNAADPYNQHICHPNSVQPTMSTLQQIQRDIAALVEGRADDERWRKLCIEKLDLLETLGDALRVERSDDRAFAENAGIDIITKLDKSHADLQAGIISLKGQLVTLDGKLVAIGNCLAGLLTLGAKRSTKRKPRGRRKGGK